MNVIRECSVCGSMSTAYCPRCRADICDTECFTVHKQIKHARIHGPDRVFRRGYERAIA